MVQRYEVYLSECLTTATRDDGRWVYFDDYEELQKECALAKYQTTQFKQMRERVSYLEGVITELTRIIAQKNERR